MQARQSIMFTDIWTGGVTIKFIWIFLVPLCKFTTFRRKLSQALHCLDRNFFKVSRDVLNIRAVPVGAD
ncbi:hypothetical protein H096_07202 [Pseudomonas sp. FH1]|nr:hypothetical protein H096_07202 [Pseudomonas sp. FH1]